MSDEYGPMCCVLDAGHQTEHMAPPDWMRVAEATGPTKVELPPVRVQGFDRLFKRLGQVLAGAIREPYFIEVENNGCEKCGHGKLWAVVGPDGVAQSTMFEDPDDAQNLADVLNEAFWRGQETPRTHPEADYAVDPVDGTQVDRSTRDAS